MKYTRQEVLLLLASATFAAAGFFIPTTDGKVSWGAWFFAFCTLVFLFAPLIRRRQEQVPAQRVEFNDEQITRTGPRGKVESIRWADLDEIGIVTTDSGPWTEDAYWIFSNSSRTAGCAIANGADGLNLLLEKIQTLPGFDNEELIRAMGCTSNNKFVVWKRVQSGCR